MSAEAVDPLGAVLTALELEPVDENTFVGRSLPQLHGRVYDGQVLAQALLAAGRTMTTERCPSSRPRAACVQVAGTAAAGGKGSNGGRGVCRRTTPSGNWVITLTAVVGIPKALAPLQELEVVPRNLMMR